MTYFHFPEWQIVGSCPELMVKAELDENNNMITIVHPIAETCPRGKYYVGRLGMK